MALRSVTGRLRRPFPLTLLAGAGLSVAYPDLLPYVVTGVALGLAATVVPLVATRSTAPFAVIAALGLLALVVASTSLFSAGDGGSFSDIAPSIEIDATSTVKIEYLGSTEQLRVERTLEVPRKQVASASLIDALEGQGWTLSKVSNRALAFSRDDTQAARHHRWIPAEQTNVVDVSVPSASVEDPRGHRVAVDFRLTEASRATLSAPQHAIGDTFPASSSSQTRPRDKREFISVALADETPQVEFEVRSPAFRNEVAASAADLSGWTIFKWLLAAALALSNEALRDLIKRGLKAVTRGRGVQVR